MNIIKKQRSCCNLLIFIIMPVIATHAFAGQHYSTDPTLGYGLYDTTCNKCGEDNPSGSKSVH